MNTVWHYSCLLPISISTSVQDVSATAKPGQVPDLQGEVMAGYSEGKFMRKTVDWTVDTALQTHDGVLYSAAKATERYHHGKSPGQSRVRSDTSFESLSAMDKPVGPARQELGMPTAVKADLASGKQADSPWLAGMMVPPTTRRTALPAPITFSAGSACLWVSESLESETHSGDSYLSQVRIGRAEDAATRGNSGQEYANFLQGPHCSSLPGSG